MRRAFLTFYALLLTLAMASCAVALSGCMVQETNRAAPDLIAHHRHERLYGDRPEFAELMATERLAWRAYYDAIGGDDAAFARAKKNLADAVAAVDKAGGGK